MKDQQASYPQLRFKGFTDPWEERKLGDLGSVAMNKRIFKEQTSDVGDIPFYKIGTFGGTPDAFISRDIFEEYKSKYQYPEVGDILISASGSIGRTVVYQGYDEYFQDSNIVWLKHDQQLDNSFLKQFYSIVKWQGLEGSTIKRLYNKNILETKITLPSPEEQAQLGSFFKQLDDTIALHQRKLAKLKELKQGYLQKMFPQNASKFPQLRFAGFADAWEQRKFEYLLDENDGIRRGPFGSALKKECFVSQSDYVVYEQQNAIYNKYETRYNITKDKFEELKKFELKPEDFIMSGAGTIGRISRVPHGIDKGVFNQALIRFRIDNRITDSEYFLQFIRADFMQKKLTSTNPGSAITNLVPMSEVKKWGILVPQINEQSKIGIFFKQLDKTITLHQRKLEKLQELKKGYLQKMFC
ncbi:restriction endonuclease subunit S [Lactiplantibacillus plantarum]|uniref:restriction endonuclease subunit S n=1 Tax=Lactiplantibacillus plantarum TaxID=1590 RepID=UPI0011CB5546|nr:restriction endonuclease subunit S [Lactiplantibacillus plantarum]TXJ67265.1 restriction endonuclease subunit S [Lactiplantibacillus plantarum]TXJ70519.1 restriction endonuclease subunit S [Lactiplantibacillus plantarum]TXJ91881.1 restriction endonuclease subunit S [Lactiplantibacillus plantarum]